MAHLAALLRRSKDFTEWWDQLTDRDVNEIEDSLDKPEGKVLRDLEVYKLYQSDKQIDIVMGLTQ